MATTPSHILIVGAGEFGLSTCLALLSRPTFSNSRITIVESSPTVPNPSGSSVDVNRIIRADYTSKPYAVLASQAQVHWRDQSEGGWGGQGRYTETGLVLTANEDMAAYVEKALENVKTLANAGLPLDIDKVEVLTDQATVKQATGYDGVSGVKGYANWNSGWAHAEKVVEYAIGRVQHEGADRVTIRTGAKVERLILKDICRGVVVDGEEISADLTIVAAGAWTPSLIDLEGRCLATGQVLAYIHITPEESARMADRPIVMNMSHGTFIIPPRGEELKIARHAYGYRNPVTVNFSGGTKQVSAPRVGVEIPSEGSQACRDTLRDWIPEMADRPWTKTRICWYCDTPDGDFLIDYHPDHQGLFIATGGSGHGFKFFPIIGEKIVDRLENKLDSVYKQMWRWKQAVSSFDEFDDGSRSGKKGMILDAEYSISP